MALDDPDLPMKGVAPDAEELKELNTITIRNPQRPDLEYSFLLPDGWFQHPAPPGRIDFSREAEFAPLGVFSASKNFLPPIVFMVGVRPAPKQGNVAEWLERHCYLQQLGLQRLELKQFIFGWAADAIAIQASDIGKLKLRVTMFEDGGRLFVLSGMAPLELWEPMVRTLSLCILSFELLQPKGQSAPLAPKPEGGDEPG
jgi:hypothetical protein